MTNKTDKQVLIAKLEKAINECNKHKKRADYALAFIKNMFPFTVNTYQKMLSDEEGIEDIIIANSKQGTDVTIDDIKKYNGNMPKLEYLDLFLYRYTKLQDKIGTNIIRVLSELLEYNLETQSFIDCLNIVERYNIIESVETWDGLRTVRNNIAHDYSDDLEYQVKILNDVYKNYKIILEILNNIKNKFDEIK